MFLKFLNLKGKHGISFQVFRVAKSISHHARFRSTMISGGGRLRPQEDSLNIPLDMIVGTPGRILQHIKDGNIVYGDIKYLVFFRLSKCHLVDYSLSCKATDLAMRFSFSGP